MAQKVTIKDYFSSGPAPARAGNGHHSSSSLLNPMNEERVCGWSRTGPPQTAAAIRFDTPEVSTRTREPRRTAPTSLLSPPSSARSVSPAPLPRVTRWPRDQLVNATLEAQQKAFLDKLEQITELNPNRALKVGACMQSNLKNRKADKDMYSENFYDRNLFFVIAKGVRPRRCGKYMCTDGDEG